MLRETYLDLRKALQLAFDLAIPILGMCLRGERERERATERLKSWESQGLDLQLVNGLQELGLLSHTKASREKWQR